MHKSFQSKRVDAINRKIERSSNKKAMIDTYVEEYGDITSTKAKNKKEYKQNKS